jgi:hypothetical protein
MTNSITLWLIQNFQPVWILYAACYLLAFVVTFVATFALYAAVIMFRNARDEGRLDDLTPSVMVIIKCLFVAGIALDCLLNWVFLTVYFRELPKEYLCSMRIKRWYWSQENTPNKRKAQWFAKNYLLPIDPSHMDKD